MSETPSPTPSTSTTPPPTSSSTPTPSTTTSATSTSTASPTASTSATPSVSPSARPLPANWGWSYGTSPVAALDLRPAIIAGLGHVKAGGGNAVIAGNHTTSAIVDAGLMLELGGAAELLSTDGTVDVDRLRQEAGAFSRLTHGPTARDSPAAMHRIPVQSIALGMP